MIRLCMLYEFDLKGIPEQYLTKTEFPTAFPIPALDASSLNTPFPVLHNTHFQHIKEFYPETSRDESHVAEL